jgi:hypothetical protein
VPRPCVFGKGGYDAAGTMGCYAQRPASNLRRSSSALYHLPGYRFYLLDEAGPVRVNEGWGKFSFRHHAA